MSIEISFYLSISKINIMQIMRSPDVRNHLKFLDSHQLESPTNVGLSNKRNRFLVLINLNKTISSTCRAVLIF